MGSLDVSSDELPVSLDDIAADDHRLDVRRSCTEHQDCDAVAVDHLGVRCRRSKVGADVGDNADTNEHVAVGEVTTASVDGDDVAALNKDLLGHSGSNLKRSMGEGDEKVGVRGTPVVLEAACLPDRSQVRLLEVEPSRDKREGERGYRQSRFDPL
jgi:hypothetical protein